MGAERNGHFLVPESEFPLYKWKEEQVISSGKTGNSSEELVNSSDESAYSSLNFLIEEENWLVSPRK